MPPLPGDGGRVAAQTLTEDDEQALEALMLERKRAESRLNRALNELLGSGAGAPAVIVALDEAEATLRAIASLVGRL